MQIQPDDKRIKSAAATVPSPQGNGSIKGYLVRPADDAELPVVIVVHENRGLNPYIEDVARRLAVADFIAFAPDALTSLGGYPGDDEKGLALFSQLDRAKMTDDFLAAATWLRARADSTGKLGAVGFCFGGGVVNQLAVRMGSDLAAGVPFYGTQPSAAEALKIKAPINAQYAELYKRITDGWPAFDAALTEAQVPHEGHIYRGANHGFHNDTTPVTTKPPQRSLGETRWTGSISICAERLRTPRPPVPMNSTMNARRSVKAPRTLANHAGRARFQAWADNDEADETVGIT